MIYFTADTHFGHYNVIRFCDRPFASAEEMDEAMIQNWNDRVTGNDTVYILGDMFFRSTNAEGILKRLKGKKRLIVGNHDGSWMTKFDYARYFFSVDKFLETSDGKRSLTLCHYPMLSWKHAKRSYMIHGHIHNDTRADFWPLIVLCPAGDAGHPPLPRGGGAAPQLPAAHPHPRRGVYGIQRADQPRQ